MRATLRSVLAMLAVALMVATLQAGSVAAAANPSVTSVLPAPGQVVGVAHPVVVSFHAPVTNRPAAERALHPKSEPPMTGRFDWVSDDVVHWTPDRFWPPHSVVTVTVGGMATGFKTGPTVLGVADISDHTFRVSIDGVEMDAAPPLQAPHHRPHHGEEGVMLASMGRPEFPTPVGTYSVLAKDRSVVMDSSSVGIPVDDPQGYRLSVDYAVRITGRGLYVHSAPWAVRSLGVDNTSHGCISLSPADAEWYFNAVNIGDPVIVQE